MATTNNPYPDPTLPSYPTPPPAERIGSTHLERLLHIPLGVLGVAFLLIGVVGVFQGSLGVFFGCIACSTVAVWVTYWNLYGRWVKPRRELVERCNRDWATEQLATRLRDI